LVGCGVVVFPGVGVTKEPSSDQNAKSLARNGPSYQPSFEKRNFTCSVPAGTGVQYDEKCSGARSFSWLFCAFCHVLPPSKLTSTVPMPLKRSRSFCGAGAAKVTVPLF